MGLYVGVKGGVGDAQLWDDGSEAAGCSCDVLDALVAGMCILC